MTTLIKNIKDNWQLLFTLLLTWSLFDLYNYYSPFGIEIISYVNLSEVILLVFPSLLNGLISVLLIIIFFSIFLRERPVNSILRSGDDLRLFQFRETTRSIKSYLKPFKLKNTLWLVVSIVAFLMNTLFLLVILLFLYGVIKLFTSESIMIPLQQEATKFSLMMFISIFFLSPIFFLISEYFERYAHKVFSSFTIEKKPITYFAIAFVIISIISNRIQYLNIINGYRKYAISFEYEQKKFKTDSTLVYIGTTSSFLFLRNNFDSTNLIFQKNNLTNITIRKISPNQRKAD